MGLRPQKTAATFQADPTYSYLKAKSLIDRSHLGQRKVLLAALHRTGAPRGQ